MRPARLSAAACLCLMAQTAGCSEPAPIPEIDVARFLDTLGVNIHLNYTDTCYGDVAAVGRDLAYLGIAHVRTAGAPGSAPVSAYVALARQRVRYDLIVPSAQDMATSVAFAQGLARSVPGSVASFEGFNEINNWPVTFHGQTGEGPARQAQAEFYAMVHRTPEMSHVPVIYLTGATVPADLAGAADVVSMHAYNNGGAQPEPWVAAGIEAMPPGVPVMNTEFGNFTVPPGWPESRPKWSGPSMLGVDQSAQAKVVLNEFLGSARLGVQRSFVYELCDEHGDDERHNAEDAFGIFTHAHQPKRAAIALHQLTTYLRAPGHDAAALRLVPVAAAAADPETLAMRGSQGRRLLVAWNRAPFWSWTTQHSGPVPEATSQLELAATDAGGRPVSGTWRISIFDPLREQQAPPLQMTANGHARVAVPNHPVFMEAIRMS